MVVGSTMKSIIYSTTNIGYKHNPVLHLYETRGFETTVISSGLMPGNETFEVTVHCMQKTTKKAYRK
jgi:hypothetical protein